MNVGTVGTLYGVVTLLVMFSGMPIAFSLGLVAAVFMYFFMPVSALDTVTQNVFEEMASITLLSIPLFILKGVAIGKSRAGSDLYLALHAWLHKIPGGLGIANVFACGLFAAMAGSSPATCAAIGSMGVPEMRLRGYSGEVCMRPDRSRWYSRYPAPAVDHYDPLRGCRGTVSGSTVPSRDWSRVCCSSVCSRVMRYGGTGLSTRQPLMHTSVPAKRPRISKRTT